jgi:type IV pilus assembly protein PilQ
VSIGNKENKVYTGSLISLDFQNADIHNILRLIGEVSGKNVVVSDQVAGKVTLKLTKVPWDQALDLVLASKNLGVQETGNVLRIDSLDAIRRATIDVSDPNTRVPLYKKRFTPVYASATTLAAELDKVKSMRGSVKVVGNEIYVEDDEDSLASMVDVVLRNDNVTKQILIESRIVEATADFTQELGVRWGGGYGQRTASLPTMPSGFPETPTPNPDTEGAHNSLFGMADFGNSSGTGKIAANLGVGFINRAGSLALSASLQATESTGQTRTVSAPRIMAANDEEVYIKQGTQVPYTSGATVNTAGTTEFKDAVMELRVTPHIEESGQVVSLDITLTKDSVIPTALGSPYINTKEARTKLMVKDGETVVIGGIIEDSNRTSSVRVPGLHNIPLLGWLFQDRDITNQKTELLIFITANIIPLPI